jgi:hypothetical protein
MAIFNSKHVPLPLWVSNFLRFSTVLSRPVRWIPILIQPNPVHTLTLFYIHIHITIIILSYNPVSVRLFLLYLLPTPTNSFSFVPHFVVERRKCFAFHHRHKKLLCSTAVVFPTLYHSGDHHKAIAIYEH